MNAANTHHKLHPAPVADAELKRHATRLTGCVMAVLLGAGCASSPAPSSLSTRQALVVPRRAEAVVASRAPLLEVGSAQLMY